ncbi:MAG: hypothetical protein IGQ88_01935 [Gloeomargaritaceae cyanobacterium C42_A2020_066]|nr:hypothetical protein [Gloeomargaritaceae cyanobacterium C42_A2020_066]
MTLALKRSLLTVAIGVGCVGVVMDVRPAAAISLTWTLSGFNFVDGTTAVGSFDYDADTNTYSNISIIVDNPIPANGVPGYSFPSVFTDSDIFFGDSSSLVLGPDNNLFDQFFDIPLTNAGGTIGVIANYGDNFGDGVRQTTGTISAVGVPVPAPPGVLGLLLSGALAARKSRRAVSIAPNAAV